MSHADTAPRELRNFGTSADLRITPGALALERYTERATAARPGPAGAPRGFGSHTQVSRQGGTAGRGQFSLACQVAGADLSFDSHYDELAHLDAWGQPDPPGYEKMGAGYMGQSGYARGFDDTCAPHDSTCSYFPPTNALAARGQDMSTCWGPACDRVHTGTYWSALCSICETFETAPCVYNPCNMA